MERIVSHPIDRFAAHVAHSLNSETAAEVRVEPGRLYAGLTATLAGARYLNALLYQPSYAWRMDPEEAASRYFDATLARRLWLSGRAERSAAHHLYEALCQRGIEPEWAAAELRRESVPATPRAESVQPLVSRAFRAVAGRLRGLPDTISPGNAAGTIRARSGPLHLFVGAARAPVAEEFSAWDAVCCAPERMRTLPAGEAFNRFCGRVIDALRTANRPVQELLGLRRGLCPFDWLETLPVNQVRGLRRFLAALPDSAADTRDAWAEAWTRAPVPGYADVAVLWRSPIGEALREHGQAPRFVDTDALADEIADEPPAVLDRHGFAEELRALVADGVIDARERSLLLALYDGAALAEALAESHLDRELRDRGLSHADYATELNRRIQAWRRRVSED